MNNGIKHEGWYSRSVGIWLFNDLGGSHATSTALDVLLEIHSAFHEVQNPFVTLPPPQ